jgi:hypothetical protein
MSWHVRVDWRKVSFTHNSWFSCWDRNWSVEDEPNIPHAIPAISEDVYLNSCEMLVILRFRHLFPSSITYFPNDISNRARLCVCVENEDILKHNPRGKDKAKWWKFSMKFQINDVWGENRHSATQGDETGDNSKYIRSGLSHSAACV